MTEFRLEIEIMSDTARHNFEIQYFVVKYALLDSITLHNFLASAGEIGGMMGKKLGFGRFRARPVIRQNDILVAVAPSLVF